MAQQKLYIDNNEHGRRRIHQNASHYDRLIPLPDADEDVLSDDIIAPKTVGFMWEIINETLWQTKALAQDLKGQNSRETFRNIWIFLHDNIQFRLDDGEELRSPSRSWYDRKKGVDCDCFTIFACSILINLGYKPIIRIGGYEDSGGGFSHVYTIMLGTEIMVIDPVLHHFNLEKTPQIKRDFMNTKTKYLHGFGDSDEGYSELGAAHAAANEPILQNLLATKEKLLNHPEVFDAAGMEAGDSHELVAMIENLVRVYGTPEFDVLINQYESSLSSKISGLGATLTAKKKVKLNFIQGVKKAVATVKTATKEAIKNPKQAVKNIAAAGVKALHAINRVNPIIAASRGLLILAMEHNLFNLAILFLDHLNRNTSFGQAITKIWNLGGGKIENLKASCAKGANRKNLKGLGFVGATVATTAGAPATIMLMEMVYKGVKEGVIKVGENGIETITTATLNTRPTSTPTTRPSIPTKKPFKGLGEGGEESATDASLDTGDVEFNAGASDASSATAQAEADKIYEAANPTADANEKAAKKSFFKKMAQWITTAFEKLGIKSAIKGATQEVSSNAVDRVFSSSANGTTENESESAPIVKDTGKPVEKPKSNTMLYVGGFAAVVTIAVIAYNMYGVEETGKALSGAISYPDFQVLQ